MLIINAVLATLDVKSVNNEDDDGYNLVEAGFLSIEDGLITGIGSMSDVPMVGTTTKVIDAEGRLMTPALIDCHTHIVHGGHRANEFELRLNGASYAEVAKAGGGIVSTVEATRNMSDKDLVDSALPRVDALLEEGVSLI